MRQAILSLCLLLLCSCLFSKKIILKGKGDIKISQEEFSNLKGWDEDDHKAALQAFLHSCRKFATLPQNRQIGKQLTEITPADFRDVCDIAEVVKNMSSKQAKNFFENWFRVFAVENRKGNDEGIFTGYYEASLNGSFQKNEKYRYPVYAKPRNFSIYDDLSRSEIEDGALQGKALELLYVDDKVDLFFMQIQGSGKVKLRDGRYIRLAFAARNKQPFVAISNQMYDMGLISRSEQNSAGVRDWLKKNPEQADKIMNINPAFVFFEIFKGEYVIGSQGVPLTPERSLAIDDDILPYGLPIWLNSEIKQKNKREKFNHLMVAQDTGSAINGTIRGDIFFGYGEEAEEKAFYTASTGRYFVLLPINVVDRLMKN